MSSQPNYWVLRQNYSEKTDQNQMKSLILEQKFVTCPWGGWGISRQNVIDGVYNYNKQNIRPGGRSSKGQDRRFVEEMNIGDIIIIPFAKKHGCVVARISSNVEYAIETGLCWTETEQHIKLSKDGETPFRPVGRRVEIINENFMPTFTVSNRMSLSKMSEGVIASLNQ
jgi:hypothetical protein